MTISGRGFVRTQMLSVRFTLNAQCIDIRVKVEKLSYIFLCLIYMFHPSI